MNHDAEAQVLKWFRLKHSLRFCSLPGLRALVAFILGLSSIACAASGVQAAPVPPEMRTSFFAVTVNNQRIDVAHAASNYEFVNFDTTGPVDISITAAEPGFWDRGVDIEPWRPESDPGAMARPSASSSKVPPNSRSRGPAIF